MTYTDIIKKLIGAVNPVGETNTDNQRYENLKELCEVANNLITMIDDVAHNYKDMPEYSIQRASNYAKMFLTQTIGITE